jgi:hypothetical protein
MNNLQKQLLSFDEDRLKRLYMTVFNTGDGQLVLQDLKNRAYTNRPYIMDEEIVDPYQIARRDGIRSSVLHIETMLEPIEQKGDNDVENTKPLDETP